MAIAEVEKKSDAASKGKADVAPRPEKKLCNVGSGSRPLKRKTPSTAADANRPAASRNDGA